MSSHNSDESESDDDFPDLDLPKEVIDDILAEDVAPFADAEELYRSRIDKHARLTYWAGMLVQAKSRRILPTEASWRPEITESSFELASYPQFYVKLTKFITSGTWDQWYLNAFILWLVLLVLQANGYFNSSYVSVPSTALLIPLALMMLFQAIPVVGTLFLIVHCNDLLRYMASHDFGEWVSVIFTFSYRYLILL